MFKDESRDTAWNEIRQHDLKSFAAQLTPEVFAAAAARANIRIGCSALNLVNLVWLGIASAMQRTSTFAFVLTTTLKLLQDQEDFQSTLLGKTKKKAEQARKTKGKKARRSKHSPYGKDPTVVSEEAFVQARQRMPLSFWMALLAILSQRFQQAHPQQGNFGEFRLLAMDGTMLPLQDLQELRDHFGRPRNGERQRACPQCRMLLLTLPGVRIPLDYTVSPLADSELTLAERLMNNLRPNDLLLMDRGFVSYGLFWNIQQRGAYFGTRLKKNIKYQRRKQLGPKDWLVEWKPKDSRGLWKDLPRSIQLRVIHYQVQGFRSSAIITNVLDPKRLSRQDWVRLASDCDAKGKFMPGLYHRRWEIETTYYELKITLKLNSLRSRTPASVQYEIASRVLYYLLIRWLIVQAAEKYGLDPLRISFTEAVRELELMRQSLITGSPAWVRTLLLRLLARIASHQVPLRPGRHYARPNDTKAKNNGRGRQKQPASKISNSVNTKARKGHRQSPAKA